MEHIDNVYIYIYIYKCNMEHIDNADNVGNADSAHTICVYIYIYISLYICIDAVYYTKYCNVI